MPNYQCPSCKKEVVHDATACPNCGKPFLINDNSSRFASLILWFALLSVFGASIGAVWQLYFPPNPFFSQFDRFVMRNGIRYWQIGLVIGFIVAPFFNGRPKKSILQPNNTEKEIELTNKYKKSPLKQVLFILLFGPLGLFYSKKGLAVPLFALEVLALIISPAKYLVVIMFFILAAIIGSKAVSDYNHKLFQ